MQKPLIYVPIGKERCNEFFVDEDWERLRALGTVEIDHDATVESVADMTAEAQVLLLHASSPRIEPQALLQGSVRMIAYSMGSVRAGGRIPKQVVDAGIAVSQSAAGMAPAVAEMSLTLALVVLRQVHSHIRVLESTRDWAGARSGLGESFSDQRIGVVGASRSGVEFIKMARALNRKPILVFDPYLSPTRAAELDVTAAPLDEVCAASTVLAIHAPTTPETHHMIGKSQLALLPDHAVVINTARSWVIDEAALLTELQAGRLQAGLDVFDTEPLPPDSPFYDLPNVVISPHRAGATHASRRLQGSIAIDEVVRFLRDEPLQHAVTSANYDQLA